MAKPFKSTYIADSFDAVESDDAPPRVRMRNKCEVRRSDEDDPARVAHLEAIRKLRKAINGDPE